MSACINELKEKNIGLDGEEFYAVMASYVAKINDLQESEKPDSMALLKAAVRQEYLGKEADAEVAEALQEYLKGQDKTVRDICMSKVDRVTKIEALHTLAVTLGQMKDIQISFVRFRSRQNSKIYDKLESDKSIYEANRDEYRQLAALRFNPQALDEFITKTAGEVTTAKAVIQENILANIVKEEDKFLAYQTKFVGRAVDLLVEDSCQIVFSAEESSEAG